jgi:hypothetical protein
VDTSEILAVLKDNSHKAEAILRAAVARVPAGPLPENRALAEALVTPPSKVPPEARARLGAILGPYLTGA